MTPRTGFPIAAAIFALLAGAADAHVTLAEPTAHAGSYYAGFFRVSHGCAGSPTLSIRIEIPKNVDIARPQPKPGWTLTIDKAPRDTPAKGEMGETERERVTAITWTGRLEADQFDQFGVMLKLPAAAGPLYFPTIQRCETDEVRWSDTPAAGQDRHALHRPAPMLEITPNPQDPQMGGMKM